MNGSLLRIQSILKDADYRKIRDEWLPKAERKDIWFEWWAGPKGTVIIHHDGKEDSSVHTYFDWGCGTTFNDLEEALRGKQPSDAPAQEQKGHMNEIEDTLFKWLSAKSQFEGREQEARNMAKWAAALVTQEPLQAATAILQGNLELKETVAMLRAVQAIVTNPSNFAWNGKPLPKDTAEWLLGKEIK